MKKAVLKICASALLVFSASYAFAEGEASFQSKIAPIAESQGLLAGSNYVVDIVIDNYHDPKRPDILVTPTRPLAIGAIKPNFSGRIFSESYPSECVDVEFTYGDKVFKKKFYRRVTIKINNPEFRDQITWQEFGPKCE